MKTSHRAIAVLLVLSALIFTLLGRFLNTLVDKNRYRLVQELQKSLGRSLTFEELRLDFWGGPGLSVTQVRVAEDPRFAAAPFIQSKELRMQLRWLPLLWGRVEVRKLILDEPEIQIIRNEAGNLNLFALAVARESPGESREDRPGAAPRLLVSSVRVVNGKIHYVDRYGSEPVGVLVRNVDLDLRGLAPAGAAEIKLGAALFETEGQNVGVEGR
ncbi:MAG: AsmA family protein, partial [bacterium]